MQGPVGVRWPRALLLTLLTGGLVAWVAVNPLTKVPLGIDEGHHAVGARYVLVDPGYAARPEVFVGGWPEWTAGARKLISFPPTVHLVYGSSLGLFGLNSAGFGMPLLFAGLAVAFALFLLGRRLWDPWTGVVAAGLFLWSAAGLREGSQYECEPLLAAFGLMGVAMVAEGTARRRRWLFAAAGASFGVAFLLKLWLGLLPAIATLPFLVQGLREDRARDVVGRWALLAVVTLLVGGSHLLSIAIATPEDLPVWLFVYFRTILIPNSGEVATATPLYYPALLYRDAFVYAIPLLVFAAEQWRSRSRGGGRESARRWLLGTLVVGVVALTFYSKHESAYLYPFMPLVALIAARGLVVLLREREDKAPCWRWSLAVGGVLLGLAAFTLPALIAAGKLAAGWADARFGVAHFIAAGSLAAAALLWTFRGANLRRGRVPLARVAKTVLVLAPVAWGAMTAAALVAEHMTDPVRPVAVAFATEPRLINEPGPVSTGKREPQYVSSYWHPLSAFLWVRGRPWYYLDEQRLAWSEVAARLGPEIRFFHIDREFRACTGCPPTPEAHAAVLTWLRRHMVDATPEVEERLGRAQSTLVFRRRTPEEIEPSVAGGPLAAPR